MPELPEVETIARRLREVIREKHISRVKIWREKSWQGDISRIIGQKIISVTRKAKVLQIELENTQSLLMHLKMTGQLIYVEGSTRVGGGHPTADWVNELPSKHTRVSIDFSEGGILHFNDLRVFGWLRVSSPEEVAAEFARYAPDIIDSSVTADYLYKRFQAKRLPIKMAIMDNSIIAGVGNIYANDALHLAKVNPIRPAQTLSFSEVTALLGAMQSVIYQGIELGGATIDNYRTVDGLAGGYQNVVRVYQREGQNCVVCSTPILRIKQGGRSTFFCPRCQI